MQSLLFRSPRPFHLHRLGKVLDHLPAQVVRGKGVIYLNTPESKGVKCLFQYVGTRGDLAAEPWKPGEEKSNTLLLLGKNWDTEEVRSKLEEALCSPEEELEAVWI